MKARQLLQLQAAAHELATPVALSSLAHGPRHWRDVARVGLTVGQVAGLGAERLQQVFVFAALHDTQRLNEHIDPQHGLRASVIHARHMSEWTPQDCFDPLQEALTHHDLGTIATDPLIGSCWDADRLTIGRVGIVPSVRYISIAEVRHDFWGFVALANSILHGPDVKWSEIAARYGRV